MPFWPFKKRRRDSVLKEKETAFESLIESEKAQELDRPPSPPPRKRGLASSPTGSPGPTSPIPIPRRSSKRPSPPPLRESDLPSPPPIEEIDQLPEALLDKENVPPPSRPTMSQEDITALPMSYELQYSPHLRPVDMERPHIPYNFRTHSGSLVSVPGEATLNPPKPNVLHKKRSSYDNAAPSRKRSNRSRKDEQVREEEIRAMSAQSPIPKRPGEGPLRRDSKKMRSGMKESQISLPAHEESVHESLPGIVEQRGWEIGAIDLFNPRPAVRLSGVPQYVTPGTPRLATPTTLPTTTATATPTSPLPSRKSEKRPVSRSDAKKRETIGSRADNLGANDIRTLMERDAKRREERKKELQEKLDRKLRKREGRNRGDSDRRKREAEDRKKVEEAARAQESVPPLPSKSHGSHDAADETVGLGIAGGAAVAEAFDAQDEEKPVVSPLEEPADDPFADPADEESAARPSIEQLTGTATPVETPMEDDAVVETAQAIRMSQAATPPLSPVHSGRAASRISRAAAANSKRASDVPPEVEDAESRRTSQVVPERRTGALASLFRRSGAHPKKGLEAKSPPSEASFSNTSRESMRGQPLPAHLVDTQPRTQVPRPTSITPGRGQSKFREDLPEMPVSPPDSRNASPDVTMAAAAAAAARRGMVSSQSTDVRRQGSTTTSGSDAVTSARYDTPVSPSLRPGTSLASVDSEGAWLASGVAKRQSKQSGLGNQRADFSSSFEELGTDTDGQHFSRTPASPDTVRGKTDTSALPGASETTSDRDFYDAPEEAESPELAVTGEDPATPTVLNTARRRPTLVQRDARVRSREGLVTEYAAAADTVADPVSAATTGRGSMEMDSDLEMPEPQLARATSVRLHARNVSTGSAKLLDVTPRLENTEEEDPFDRPRSPVSPLSPE